MPLHPVVPNPYTLLPRIPEGAAWFTVLDLKDAFFCIPLAPESQFLFALEDPVNPSVQLTWTVLPQGFRDNPHLFGQVLAKDLASFDSREAEIIQYVDDILLCTTTETECQESTQRLLNFLADCGYKVSHQKAQTC